MLSVALFPIGLIAVVQTQQLSDAARSNAELSLLSFTEHASLNERMIVQRARGNARLLGHLSQELTDPAKCAEHLGSFIEANPHFSFVGFLPVSGAMTCSSATRPFDFSKTDGFDDLMSAGKPTVVINKAAPLSGRPVIVVSEPYFLNDTLVGMVSISVPREKLDEIEENNVANGFLNAVTFNATGTILTSEDETSDVQNTLPRNINLEDLVGESAYSFSAEDRSGIERIYTFVPIEDGLVFTLGIWEISETPSAFNWTGIPASIFPVLMWLASLAVALVAVYRLVIRHIGALVDQMRGFAKTRELPETLTDGWAPAEIVELGAGFQDLADVIIRDEAKQENNLRDKSVLIKEVHHRVKNNLQLISSIMNMQIRKAKSAETKAVLGRVQDRVLSLATIHRDLYQSSAAGLVDASALIREIVEKSAEIGSSDEMDIDLRLSLDPVSLYPDQAVPISLLASEAATNAMKYLGKTAQGKRWIDVSLTLGAQNQCQLVFANSVSDTAPELEDSESTGLGAQLIKAFAIQLGGKISTEETDDQYRIVVDFEIAEFSEEAVDF